LPSADEPELAGKLRQRIGQHLVGRDSSVAVGTSAAGINPDYIKEVRWWKHAAFLNKVKLLAAELVAFDVLNPTLKSRGFAKRGAKKLYATPLFNPKMRKLFQGTAHGSLEVISLEDVIRCQRRGKTDPS